MLVHVWRVCGQAINYNKRYGFTAAQLALYHRLFSTHTADMDPVYVNKVRCEYQWSRFAHRQAAAASKAAPAGGRRRRGRKEEDKGRKKELPPCAVWSAVDAGVVADLGIDALFAA